MAAAALFVLAVPDLCHRLRAGPASHGSRPASSMRSAPIRSPRGSPEFPSTASSSGCSFSPALLSGLAAVLLTARIGSTRPNIALGWELEVVTMVILGGVSIAGGSGTILGVVHRGVRARPGDFRPVADQRAGHRHQRDPRLPADRLDHASDLQSAESWRRGNSWRGWPPRVGSELSRVSATPGVAALFQTLLDSTSQPWIPPVALDSRANLL